MNCNNPILVEPFGQPSLLAAVSPQIAHQLQALIAQVMEPILERITALEDAHASLEAMNAALEATNASLVERLRVLEAARAPPVDAGTGEVHSPQQVPPPPATAILEEIIQLRADLEEHNEARALEIAQDRRRLAALEIPKRPPPTAKTLAHLDRLDREMRGSRIKQVSFANAARILGLSHTRIQQLRPLISEDRRFTIVKDPHHKQRLLIRLNFRM